MLKKMRIKKRLTTSFILVAAITSIAAIVGCIAMLYIANQYEYSLKNYGFSQGDIGKAMVNFSETRSATRLIIAYTDADIIAEGVQIHDSSKTSFESNFSKIKATLTADEENAAYEEAETALAAYWKLENEILELGNTTDEERSKQAQLKAEAELTPKYDAVYNALSKLMNLNVTTGNSLSDKLAMIRTVLLIVIIGVIILAVVISIVLGEKIAKGIAAPLGALSDRLKTFAAGDLSKPFPQTDSQDEVSDMISEASNMAANLSLIVSDVGQQLGKMAAGNYQAETKIPQKYVGEFSSLRDSMATMNSKMNDTLKRIDEAAGQVSAGANNMAQAAQSLAEGATDQAGSVEELQATITNIAEGVQKTAQNAELSYRQAKDYAKEADKSRMEMQVMVSAMERINETSLKIGNIISEIEDIATQTNLLSLNAAIEAARAGEAGRGFSVVAERIRSLAEQSTKSAVDTRELIEGAIQEVTEGNKAANNAATSIGEVVTGIQQIAGSSKELSDISTEQAQAMTQVELGINQISEVVQSNSATAEETSATSEELSAQASTLSDLVGMFQLK